MFTLSAVSSVLKVRPYDRDPSLPTCKLPWIKEEGHRLRFSEAQGRGRGALDEGTSYLAEALTVRILCFWARWGEFSSVDANACHGAWIKLDKTKTDTPEMCLSMRN